MKVLHVNVRLQEGGAARIALDLHRRLLNIGVDSRFAYGWGEKGRRSSAEDSVSNSFQVGRQFQVASNIVLNRLIGFDIVPPIGPGRNNLVQSMRWADIIHLHVIHSYFMPFGWLVRQLVREGKPVVWTAHDYWMLTGRCASFEKCNAWQHGCGSCLTRWNYPPSYFDFSAKQFKLKRELLTTLRPLLHVVAPSEFVARSIREVLSCIDVSVIPNWIDSELEAALNNAPLDAVPIDFNANKIKVAVIANDLSDSTKVDRQLIRQLQGISHIEIHTFGRHSPFYGTRVINHGYISDRKKFLILVSSSNVALFTSIKDTFGLVMIEALACGVPVLALDSLSTREILPILGGCPIKNKNEIVWLLENAKLPNCYKDIVRSNLRENVLNNFCGNIAVNRYLSSYKGALQCQ